MVCSEIHLQHSLKPCFSVYNCIFKELYLHVDWDLVLEVNITSAQNMRCPVTQSCPTLCGPMVYSLPGFSVHGILQTRIREWLSPPTPGDLPNPETELASLVSPALTGRFFTTTATWEAPQNMRRACYQKMTSVIDGRYVKKAECQRIDTFKIWCWKRLLKVSWSARRSNQSILREINPEYSLEGLMLKLQYFGHLM